MKKSIFSIVLILSLLSFQPIQCVKEEGPNPVLWALETIFCCKCTERCDAWKRDQMQRMQDKFKKPEDELKTSEDARYECQFIQATLEAYNAKDKFNKNPDELIAELKRKYPNSKFVTTVAGFLKKQDEDRKHLDMQFEDDEGVDTFSLVNGAFKESLDELADRLEEKAFSLAEWEEREEWKREYLEEEMIRKQKLEQRLKRIEFQDAQENAKRAVALLSQAVKDKRALNQQLLKANAQLQPTADQLKLLQRELPELQAKAARVGTLEEQLNIANNVRNSLETTLRFEYRQLFIEQTKVSDLEQRIEGLTEQLTSEFKKEKESILAQLEEAINAKEDKEEIILGHVEKITDLQKQLAAAEAVVNKKQAEENKKKAYRAEIINKKPTQ